MLKEVSGMSTHADTASGIESRPLFAHGAHVSLWTHLGWFVAGAALGFVVPFVFSSGLELNHDLYYGIYFAIALAFLAAYVVSTGLDAVALFSTGWKWSLLLAIPATAFVVGNVLSRDSTPGASGAYAVFEVFWRGVAYGIVDALLLTAFPAAVAFALLAGKISGLRRRLLFAAVMLPMVLVITGTYHLGYEQFREDGIGPPEIGNTIISVPSLVAISPAGSVVAHSSMHVAADLHVYETETFLPPQIDAPDQN